jgi:hypothetical protein
MVEQPQHLLDRLYLWLMRGRAVIRHLLEHEPEQHVDLGVRIDQPPELIDHWQQRLFALRLDAIDQVPHPPVEERLVRGKPPANTKRCSRCHHLPPPAGRHSAG